jgi:hypothetical protein
MAPTNIDNRVCLDERLLIERILAQEGYNAMVAPRELVEEIRALIRSAMQTVPEELRLTP